MMGDFEFWAGKFAVRQPYNRLQRLKDQVQLGDVLTFWIDKEGITRHVAAYIGTNSQRSPCMIHSYAKENRGVMETVIDPQYWTRRVTGIYRLHEFCGEGI